MTPTFPTPRRRERTPGPALCAALLAGIVALCILLPAAYAVVVSVGGDTPDFAPAAVPALAPPPGHNASLLAALGRTFVAAFTIALLATTLALPAAWVIREASAAGARRVAACVAVLMLPNYLAYAGLNLLRAPLTTFADWLADRPPWVSVLAGQLFAFLGLALWAWPAAAIVLGLSLRRLGQDQLDALTLTGAGPFSRARVLARAMLPGLAGAFAIVFLLMLGSPVPLHVAQFDTYAVALWRRLNETGDPVRVWIAAWPVVLVAAVLAALVTRELARRVASDADPRPPLQGATPSRPARATLWLVLALSLLLPLFLHARATAPPGTTFSFHALIHTTRLFWHESAGALAESAVTAAGCAATHLAIALATWASLACTPRSRFSLVRTITLVAVAILLAAAITPGAILGSMAAGVWTNIAPLRALADTPLPVIATHTARFGAIAALLGAWAALLEPPALRDLRELDAPGSLRAFFRACVRANWPVPVAAAIAGFVLSLHEIESTVFVQPPGAGALAQKLLDALHYSRDDRLGAATITLALVSLALAYGAAWVITRPRGPSADHAHAPE